MLNEIIKTAEELNTAALYYRQSGNMDGVRELAKAHAVSQKQTEKFIQGSRYRLVDIPIEERKFANASEKLRAEMFALKDAGFADIIGQYLVNLAKTDSALDAQVLKKHKMLQRCLDYVTQKAWSCSLNISDVSCGKDYVLVICCCDNQSFLSFQICKNFLHFLCLNIC